MEKEIFIDVPGFEGHYKVSNLGRVMSLKYGKNKVLPGSLNKDGYRQYSLQKKGVFKVYGGHQIVAIAFLNHTPKGTKGLVVDHIDNDRQNNHLSNLRLLTNRENSIRYRPPNKTSKYIGVSIDRQSNTYTARISIQGNDFRLGSFKDEISAHKQYLKALKYKDEYNGSSKDFRELLKSK